MYFRECITDAAAVTGLWRHLVVAVGVPVLEMLALGHDQFEHLAALDAHGGALLLHEVPQEVVLLRLRAAKAADDARGEDALDDHGVLDGTTGTVEDVALLDGREITLDSAT